MVLQQYDRKYLSLKRQTQAFSQPLTANKNSCQPQAALQVSTKLQAANPIHDPLITNDKFKTFKKLLLKYDKTAKLHILTNIILYGEISLVKNKQKSMNNFLIPLMVTLSIQC